MPKFSPERRLKAISEYAKRVSYDPETGHITLLKSRHQPYAVGRRMGRPIVTKPGTEPYRYVTIACQSDSFIMLEHRFIWFLMTGKMPELSIDHINRNREDNRWVNLRLATSSQQRANQSPRSRKRTNSGAKYRGVSQCGQKFRTHIHFNGKSQSLGSYETEEEAAYVYDLAAIDHFGLKFYTPQTFAV
jgi:hypothetical protein